MKIVDPHGPENPGIDDRFEASKLHKQLKGDLDNIVLKALNKQPVRRYASVEQLAEDVRRHLDGLPVLAVSDSLFYRSKKFIRRHALIVTAAALLLLAVLGGVLATLHQAGIAAFNEQKAEARFNDVRKLANSLLFDIHDSIQNLPGSVPARKLLVERALQYLDSLSHESSGDPSLQRELASAYLRVGDVQGYPFSANLGDAPGAIKSYHYALQISQALLKANPANTADSLRLATVCRHLAETDSVNQNISGAQEEGQQAVKIGEDLAARLPQDAAVLTDLIKDYQTLAGIEGGNITANLGDADGGLVLHRKAAAMAERLYASGTPNAATARMLAGELIRLGDQLLLTGTWREAEKLDLRAADILARFASPNDATMQVDLAEAYSHASSAQVVGGNFAGSQKSVARSLQIYKALEQADPANVNDRIGVMLGYLNTGDTELKLGNIKGAQAALETAQGIANRFTSVAGTAEIRSFQAIINVVSGEVSAHSGNPDAALQHYRTALAIFEQLTKDDSSNVDSRLSLAATYDKVGEGLLAKKNATAAADAFRKALELAQTVSLPRNAMLLYVTADSYTGLGDSMSLEALNRAQSIKVQTERWKSAQSFYEKSLEIWNKVPEPGIENPDGFNSVPPAEVVQRLTRCRQFLEL